MTSKAISAGGIVLRPFEGGIDVVVVERAVSSEGKWAPLLVQLPKGGVQEGESLEAAAQREVREETGYSAVIVAKAGLASWQYVRQGSTIRETVHYYFMKLASSVAGLHDDEFDAVSWVPIERAAELLSYPEERSLLQAILREGKVPYW